MPIANLTLTPHNIPEYLKVHCIKCPNNITHYTVSSAVQHIQHFHISTQFLNSPIFSHISIDPPHWCLHLIVVRRFEYASDPESYTSGSVATGRASPAGQVKG